MGDVALRWLNGQIDLIRGDTDLTADDGLRTAILLSLFTDRRAEADDDLPAADGDRRGWWADEFAAVEGDLVGSRLWLLHRSARLPDVPRRAEEYTREALAWMLEDRVATRIDVEAEWVGAVLEIRVTIYRPSGETVNFRFGHVWDAESAAPIGTPDPGEYEWPTSSPPTADFIWAAFEWE